MRYAILSDIHANAAALRVVLTDAADMHAERIVCLGDVLGYGPEPVEALELTYRRAHVCLAGNHDDAVAGRYPERDFTEFAAAAVKRHRAALAQKAIDWLRHLPHTCEFQSPGGGAADGAFACAHGEFYDPKHFDYILEPADAMPSWRERTEQLLFVGHTHKPGIFVLGESGVPHALEPMDFTLEPGKRYLVNVGSVGYPRSGACRSFYCIYDDQSRTVFFRSLPFDLDGSRAKMNGQGMDEAPWMKARARERKPAEIRGMEKFAAPSPARPKRTISVKSPPPPTGTAASPGGGAAASRPSSRFGRMFFLGATLLALGGIWCTIWLVRALREGRKEAADVRAVEMASSSVEGLVAPTVSFSKTEPLLFDWEASFEHPDCQKVEFAGTSWQEKTVLRLTSETNGVVCIRKRIKLEGQPPKVYYTVKLATTARPGETLPFQFVARVVFLDAADQPIGENLFAAPRSTTNHSVAVPSEASSAELRIECRLKGTFDLAIPAFGTKPIDTGRSRRPARASSADKNS